MFFNKKIKHLTVVIKPTMNCNMNCSYCYAASSKNNRIMKKEILELIIKEIINISDSIKFIWHGGEPLMAGVEFYKHAFNIQEKYSDNKKISNGIGTNLTLLNDDYINLFKKYNVSITTSLDGPQKIHNKTRIFSNKVGSFNVVWNNIQRLREKGIVPGIICTLNKNNYFLIGEIYNFFKKQNLNFKINELFFLGNAVKNKNSVGINEIDYAKSMIKLYDLWYQDKKTNIEIENFTRIVKDLLNKCGSECYYIDDCYNKFIDIDSNGEIYSCAKFYNDKKFRFGNIKSGLDKIWKNSKLKNKLYRIHNMRLKKCIGCEFIKLCKGACMGNAYIMFSDIYKEDNFCEAFKLVFKHIKNSLKEYFPKTGDGRDLMMDAPAEIGKEQLKELGLEVKNKKIK